MKNPVEVMAAALRERGHSFDHIRKTTGLKLTDEQFRAMVRGNRERFKLIRMVKVDEHGAAIRPGRIGARMVAPADTH